MLRQLFHVSNAARVNVSQTYSANASNVSLDVSSLGGYVAGKSDITITVNSGIYIYSTSTTTPALTITGAAPTDTVTLVNNGYIMGMGGQGGGTYGPGFSIGGLLAIEQMIPENGGPAISLRCNITINNTNASAYIGGGGGGGGSGSNPSTGFVGFSGETVVYCGGGGGAGGGAGGGVFDDTTPGILGNFAGGTGGAVGAAGGNGSTGIFGPSSCCCLFRYDAATGGGGGRIFPGTGGSLGAIVGIAAGVGGGAGGSGCAWNNTATPTDPTNNGGSAGAAGGNVVNNSIFQYVSSGGGGGWGASGGRNPIGINQATLGASGGPAVITNQYSVTWTSGDTTRVYGAIV